MADDIKVITADTPASVTATPTASKPVDSSAPAGAGSKLLNPLRDHNHYNYVITLGILGISEINNPSTYRNGGFKKIILRSGGGEYNIRQQVYVEQGEHAEYFIENLEIDAVIAPNDKTGVALGTTVRFEVIEPYSMGKFIESLRAAAESTGYNSFNNAPYCLRVEFFGWNEYGDKRANYVAPPYFLPIIITKVDFNLKESGSIYQIEAVPYSEIALSQQIDTIHTEIKVTGKTVHEILENGEVSVTSIINDNMKKLEENTTVSAYDRYMILFPSTPTTIMDAIGAGKITREGMVSITNQALAKVDAPQETNKGNLFAVNPELNVFLKDRVAVKVNTEIYQILKSLSVDKSKMNSLGLSKVEAKVKDGGTNTPSLPVGIYEPERAIMARNSPAAQANPDKAEYIFYQNERITEIIDSILLDSEEIRKETQKELKGSPKLYRVETFTFIIDNPAVERIIGRPPRVYVYAVHPYVSDQSHFLAANSKPTTTEELKRNAVKEYNYFYTGKNEDILNFDITYNYAFFQAVFSDFGQLVAGERIAAQNGTVVSDPTLSVNPPVTGSVEAKATPSLLRVTGFDRRLTGSPLSDAGRQLAIAMHNIFINSNVDLINAEMKIWGDPYYLPTILGNYTPTQASNQSNMITADNSINYLRNDVMVVINFANPLDYEINGPLMTFNKDVNPAFSGVYQVLGVTNQFRQGQFTQDVKMIRQRGQEITGDASPQAILEVSGGTGSLNSPQPAAPKSVSATPARGITLSQNPAAALTALGTVVDQRVGVWANESLKAAAGAAVPAIQGLTNPIAGLTGLGRVLADAPATIQSVLSNVRVNTPLGPARPNTPQ